MSDAAAAYNPTKDSILTIKALCRKSLLPWVTDVVFDWAIIILTLCLCAKLNTPLMYFAALLIIGNRQHALAVLGHEGTHYTLHSNKKLNDLLTNIFCFWPLFLTVDGYRRLHFTHHKNTGTVNDPELLHKKSRAPQWDLPLNKRKVLGYALKDIVGYSIPDFWIILTFSGPRSRKLLVPVIALHLALITVSSMMGLWWAMPLWYAALPTTFMMFFRFRLWLEHQGTFDTQRITLTPLQAVILAPHNIWLHWEHHRYPAISYRNLGKARKLLQGPPVITLSELISNLCAADFLSSGAALESTQSHGTTSTVTEDLSSLEI
jgi:fatty acid desaturase